MRQFLLKSCFCFLTAALLHGAEYYVGENAQFKTIGEGVRAMKPGDTLTILPGVYFESIEHAGLGNAEKKTVIRAQHAGTVLLRGDKEAPVFHPVSGTRFTFVCDWKENALAVNERDSLKILLPSATLRDLEFERGRFFHDRKNGKLYISTTDGGLPSRHYYTISVICGNGIYLKNPVNVTIDGIYVTGFYSHERVENRMSSALYGIRINYGINCIIRNCIAFFNANGIHSGHGDGNVLEHCTVYANGSHNPSSGGQLVIWGPVKNSVIRNCVSFFSAKMDGAVGIRIYGGRGENCRIENCISFGEQATAIKLNENINSWCVGNYSESGIAALYARNNTAGGVNEYNTNDPELLRIDRIRRDQWDTLFADPARHDFRPQEEAPDISRGLPDRKNVFFVSPFGNDSASGRSLKNAWKTLKNLKPDSTVYFLPGVYGAQNITVSRVLLSSRGTGAKAIFKGSFSVAASDVHLRDLNFIQGKVSVSGANAEIKGCGFSVPVKITGRNARIFHNAFIMVPEWNATASAHSNLLPDTIPTPLYSDAAAGDFTLKNAEKFAGRGFDALPIGPYRLLREAKPAKITGPFVRSVTATTANIEWWTDRSDVSSELYWGADPSCGKKVGKGYAGGSYHSATISGLEPGKKYYFYIASRSPLREHHSNTELAIADKFKARELVKSEVAEFTTATREAPRREYFVAFAGNDENPGTKDAPLGSISRAMELALAGDTVTVEPGVYSEHVMFRSGGDNGREILLRSAVPGGAVIDGRRKIPVVMTLNNKSHITVDGFTFRNVGGTRGACLRINNGRKIVLRRCFSDGRSSSYTPGLVRAEFVENLLLDNCVIISSFFGGMFMRCPDLVVRNCVWYLNARHLYVHNQPDEPVLFKNCLMAENLATKHVLEFFRVWHLEALKVRNCAFYLRMPKEHRTMVAFVRKNGDRVDRQLKWSELKAAGVDMTGTIFGNPDWSILPKGLMMFSTPPELDGNPDALVKHYYKESARFSSTYREMELGQNQTAYDYKIWKIEDFIPRNPEFLKKEIGLLPEMFH